jgi:membrane-associated phospholipid phosphatase
VTSDGTGRTATAVAGAAAAAAVGWSWWAVASDRDPLEELGRGLRRSHGRNADILLATATDVGSVYGLAGTVVVVGVGMGRRAAVEVAGAGALGWFFGQAAKPLVDRPRPWQTGIADLLVHPPMGSSWPSGHTAVSTAVATALTTRGRRVATVAWLLAGMVGGTRVHVGAHHPTDVVAGAGVGILSGLAFRGLNGLASATRRRVGN